MTARNPSAGALTHVNAAGEAHMVDVGGKPVTSRSALAEARVLLGPAAFAAVRDTAAAKGDVLGTARIAGIMAAKRCAELIPLCHSLPLSFVGVEFELDAVNAAVRVMASCRTDHRTGVEMEAMTAASVAALTLYDMCKGIDKGIRIEGVRLLEKTGGKSGRWTPDESVQGLEAGQQAGSGAVAPQARDAAPPAGQPAPAPEAPDVNAVVSLIYFARTAELTGCRHETFELDAPLDGHSLLRRLGQRHPALQPVERLHLAVNHEHVAAGVLVRPGDEVAVFEPVTGG